jgi:hypothetical protein
MQGTPQGERRALYLTADRGLPGEEPVVVQRFEVLAQFDRGGHEPRQGNRRGRTSAVKRLL